jgi:hypothetical protein
LPYGKIALGKNSTHTLTQKFATPAILQITDYR